MLEVFRNWMNRYLSDEEALLLALILTGFLLVIIFMGTILMPFLTGIVLAYIMHGVVERMARYRVPEIWAVLFTYLIFLGGFVTVLLLIIPLVWRQMRNLFEELPTLVARVRQALEGLPEAYPELVSRQQVESWTSLLRDEAGDIGQWILSFSLSQVPTLIAVAVYTLLVPILVFFLLKDREGIIGWFASFLPDERPLMQRLSREMDIQLSNYLRGKFVEFLIVSISSYLLFALFGLNYAALLAFLVGLSVMVPYLGVAAVTVPVTFVAYAHYGLTEPFLYLMGGYAVLQALDGFLLVPLLFSEANKLHPIAIILAVLVFGAWWGFWGVLFAIPLAILIKALIDAWPHPE